MRIASVTNTPLDPSLGSGKTVIAWSEGFRQLGHHVDVFGPESFYRPLLSQFLRRLKFRWDAFRLAPVLENGKYDLIEFYGGEFGWLIRRLALANPKLLLVAHTNGLELLAAEHELPSSDSRLRRYLRWPIQKAISQCDQLSFSATDRFAAICSLDAEYIISRGIKRHDETTVVEPGIDKEFLSANWKSRRDHMVCYLGSWSERKDTTTLVSVLSRLLMEDEALKAELVGCSYQRHEILASFSPQLRERIYVHEKLEKIAIVRVLERAKVFLFPSLYEGFGMATSEAMACGCAVVVTPTGFGASLKDGENAFIRPFRDVEGFVDATRMLLADSELRDRFAKTGRTRVESMSWGNQVRNLEQAYRKWCETVE